MRIFICKYEGKLILCDLLIHRDIKGKQLSVGFPTLRFNLTEELEDASQRFCEEFDIKEGNCCKMELRKWPEG